MNLELRITWSGPDFGLNEHELSLGAFGKPLQMLYGCVRRSVSNELTKAGADPTKGGRLAAGATDVDLRLTALHANCVSPVLRVVRPETVANSNLLFDPALERGVRNIIEDIRRESAGTPANNGIRDFLREIPPGVRQKFGAFRDGVELDSVDVDAPTLVTLPTPPGRTQVLSAEIVGVGFPPGKVYLRLRTNDGVKEYSCREEALATAWGLRGRGLRVLVNEDAPVQVVWLREEDGEQRRPSDADVRAHILERWDAVLRELAR